MLVNLVNYAKQYASKGFSVIPIDQTSKRPLIKFADKPALTEDEIEEVWKKYPLANIALKCEKFFVIDIDRHGEVDGLESIKNLNHNEWFTDTLAEVTAHDGYHYYFQKPKDKEISQIIGLLPGVDLKAHKNNYVVVAPSSFKGKSYQWLNHKPIRPAPAGLLELIESKKPQYDPSNINTSYKSGEKTQTAMLFEEIINGLGPTGGRNNALASFVGGLLIRNVDPDVAFTLATIANENTADKLSPQEVERTVNSMIAKEVRRRRYLSADG